MRDLAREAFLLGYPVGHKSLLQRFKRLECMLNLHSVHSMPEHFENGEKYAVHAKTSYF